MVVNGKEFVPKDDNIWKVLEDEFKRVQGLVGNNLKDYPDILRQTNLYIETNLKLIKKYGKV